MNIAHLTDNLVYGGFETHISTLLNGLSNKGHNVHLISQRLSKELYDSLDSNIKTLELPRDIEVYTNYIKDNDIEILHGHPVEALGICVEIANKLQLPKVITYHGLYGWNWGTHNDVDRLITVSDEVKNKINLAKVVVIKNGINNNKIFKKYEYDSNKPMLFIGRLDADKFYCIKTLISVLKNFNVKLVVAGSGSYIDELIKIKPLFVETLGYINDMDLLNEVINNSSIVYGTGRGLREAMLCGKVCISLDACGYDGIVTKDTIQEIEYVNFSGRSNHRKPTVENTMLNDLNYLFNNIDKQIEISNWSYEYAIDNFKLNDFINRHEEIYRNLVI